MNVRKIGFNLLGRATLYLIMFGPHFQPVSVARRMVLATHGECHWGYLGEIIWNDLTFLVVTFGNVFVLLAKAEFASTPPPRKGEAQRCHQMIRSDLFASGPD